MKRIFFLFFLVTSTLSFFISCSGSSESRFVGTWKAQKVETDFNETRTTPEMIAQVVEMQKQTYFRMVNDSVMSIISKNNTHEAKWKYDKENKTISYYFSNMKGVPNILGKYEDGKIVAESNVPIGRITIYYEKE
ncbi:MAG: hypothetical protein KKF98_16395 [Bacteroidetes bacterium]|jgi:hypothetical protein|nr:hypothetical protein [Bacteroidota bacterium]